jgi:hypothetical protein
MGMFFDGLAATEVFLFKVAETIVSAIVWALSLGHTTF